MKTQKRVIPYEIINEAFQLGRFEEYLNKKTVSELLSSLDIQYPELLHQEITHFSEEEAGQRDKLVKDYFGEDEITHIVNSLVNTFLL